MRSYLAVVLAALLGITFVQAGEKKVVVGLAAREIVNDFNRGIIEGVEEVVKAHGGEVIVTDGQADIRKHLDNISSLITRGVDAIIVQLGDAEQFVSVFEKAAKANIPVITTTVGQTTPGALCDVNGDDEYMAVILGRQLLNDIKAKGRVYIISVPGAPILEVRVRLMKAFLEGYPGVKVVEVLPTQHSVPYTLNVMQNILTANPNPGDVAAVFVTYDLLASGAVQAIKNAGRGEDIKVYAIDGDEIGFQMLLEPGNPFAGTVSQDVKGVGRTAAEYAFLALEGKKDQIPYAACPAMTLVSRNDRAALVKFAKEKWGEDCLKRWGFDEKEVLGQK